MDRGSAVVSVAVNRSMLISTDYNPSYLTFTKTSQRVCPAEPRGFVTLQTLSSFQSGNIEYDHNSGPYFFGAPHIFTITHRIQTLRLV